MACAMLLLRLTTALFLSLLVTAVSGEETANPSLDSLEIFTCRFEQTHDINYDGWPDSWRRETGVGYPHYVGMLIAKDPDLKDGQQRLLIQLDGAQAKVSSPPILVLPKFSYTLSLKLKVERVEHSRVTVVLDFMTSTGEVVQTHRSESYGETDGWQEVGMAKYRAASGLVDHAVAHIEIARGERGDVDGRVSIADVRLERWPSMEVTTNSQFNVYNDPDNVVVTCALSGIREANPDICFQLLDATQSELGEEGRKELKGRVIREERLRASDILKEGEKWDDVYEGDTQWRPDIKKHGFYRVHVEMISKNTGLSLDQRTITLAIVPEGIQRSVGEFGWSLPETVPRLGKPLDFATLQELLPLAGVSWVKLPVWFPREEVARGDAIIQFAERLAATDIETIGILQPPEQGESGEEGESEIEYTFRRDASVWLPYFDHVMNRLSLRLRWWQLGYDRDTSFVGHEDLVDKIGDIRKQLYRFGQDVRLGLGWRWDAQPTEGDVPWEFEQYSSNPPLQSDQLDYHLATRASSGRPRWVLIEPVIDEQDTQFATVKQQHEARVREFIKQIVVAKKSGAEGIYIPTPFSGANGVMNTDGTPGELLLPWRTAATLLGGAEFIGSLQLPNHSDNWLFLRPDKQVVMVVWNEREAEEILYLGEDISRFDVWGKQQKPETDGHRQVLRVGPAPSFVLGVNEAVARWRMSVKFQQEALPSVFGIVHHNMLSFQNAFPAGVGGTVSVFVPHIIQGGNELQEEPSGSWEVFLPDPDVRSATGRSIEKTVEITLSEAPIGDQPVRVDFKVMADRLYQFSVWRGLRVGLGEIEILANSRLEGGRLIVEQQMISLHGPPVDFKCRLDVQGRIRKRSHVFQLTNEPDKKTYSFSRGEELIHKEMKLQVEEVDGDRRLIYKFIAQPTSDTEF